MIVVITGLLVFIPLVPVVYQSLVDGPLYQRGLSLTLNNYFHLLTSEQFYGVIKNTLLFAVGTALLSVLMGAVIALLTVRTDMPGRGWIGSIFTLPIYTSSLILALAWIAVYGPGGYGTLVGQMLVGFKPWDLYSMGGMVLVGSVAYAAIPYFYCSSFLMMADPSLEQAAQISGARRVQTFWHVILPLLRPALSYSLLFNLVTGIEMLSIPLVFGAPVGMQLFSTFLYDQIGKARPQYELVASAAVVVLGFMTCLIWLQNRMLGDLRRFVTVRGKGMRPQTIGLGPFRYPVAFVCSVWVIVLILIPLGGLILRAFTVYLTPTISPLSLLTLNNLASVFEFDKYVRSIWNTLVIAGVGGFFATMLVIFIVLVANRSDHPMRSTLRYVSLYPLAIPGVIVGIGFLWGFMFIPFFGAVRATLLGLTLAFTMRYIPLALGAIAPTLGAIGEELDRAALVSGANWFGTIRWILLPLLRPACASAYALLFLSFVREYTAAVFIYLPGTEVLGTTMLELWSQGEMGAVAALATVEVTIILAVAVASRRLLGVRMYG